MITIMSPECSAPLLALADAEIPLADGRTLFRTGDPVRCVYMVRSGCIRLERHQASGDPLILQRASTGQMPAEASVFATRYHCDAVAAGDAIVARIPKARVLALQEQDTAWMRAFAAHLAHEVQRTRARVQLLSLKRVDARLDAWLSLNGETLPDRGQWVALAFELAVTPEALYRELSRRRGAGGRGAATRQLAAKQ
jgi:CRP/FNR family transcriptional regulator, dissimilatory nitrate respiration regulator